MKKEKNILFLANGFSKWKGGLYYVKNMLYALLKYEETVLNLNIYVLVDNDNYPVFKEFADNYDNVTLIFDKVSILSEIRKKIRKFYWTNVFNKPISWSLSAGIMEKYNIDMAFPVQKLDYYYRKRCVCWIPDFQQNHFPDFFSEQELKTRERVNGDIARWHHKLILSSCSAMKDYNDAYPNRNEGVYVVPFVSAIECPISCEEEFNHVLEKFSLPSKYFIVSNQFWRHKNHRILFEAVDVLRKKWGVDVVLACTGQVENDRNPEYAKDLLKFIQKRQLQNHIKILGLIERSAQLQLIDRSVALIQPSLFEGWGTSVEDAKSLGKRIIMSDIPVHYEQKTEDCIFFEKNNVEQLAEVMNTVWTENEWVSESSYDMKKTAAIYGKEFYKVLIK